MSLRIRSSERPIGLLLWILMFTICVAIVSSAECPIKLAQKKNRAHHFRRTCTCTLHLPRRQRQSRLPNLLKYGTSVAVHAVHNGCPFYFALTNAFSNEAELPVNCIARGRI